MIAVYGSRGYSVEREAMRVVNALRFGEPDVYADKVCGDTIRHIRAAMRQAGWIESEHGDNGRTRFYVTFEKSPWIA